MKKLLLTLPYLFSIFFGAAQVPTEKSLLWKIEGKGITKPSYLYGTIHIMCPDDINVTPKLKAVFNTTQQLFLEINTQDLKGMMSMLFGITMNDGSSLKTLLKQEEYDSLAVIFKEQTGMALGPMSRMKPLMLMSMLYPSMLGCKPEGWEDAFTKLAVEKNIPLDGLEKIEDQLSVMDSIPYEAQADMFKKMLFNMDSSKAQFNKMVEVYKRQDIQEMISMTTGDDDFGAYENVMLVKRNNNWIPVMADAMKKKPSFFAVGAAHLGGEHGVINLLRKQGYKVTPVKY